MNLAVYYLCCRTGGSECTSSAVLSPNWSQ